MLSSSDTKGLEIHSFTIVGCGCDSKSDTYFYKLHEIYIALLALSNKRTIATGVECTWQRQPTRITKFSIKSNISIILIREC